MFENITDSLSKVVDQMFQVLPSLMGAIVLILVGWLLAKIISGLTATILKRIGIEKLAEKLNETKTFKEANLLIKPVGIIKKIIFWTLMLVTILGAAETLGLDSVSQLISDLINYLPQLLTAFLILAIGFYIADAIRDMVGNTCKSLGIPAWKIISLAVFYILFLVIVVTALNQAGVDTTIIISNVSIILGGIALAFAIAYGYAARPVLSNILTSYYNKTQFQIGQTIEIDQNKGTIVNMSNHAIILDVGDQMIRFPMSRLNSDKVIIYHNTKQLRIEEG
ncbi:MAG: hypothetical protein AAF587_24740 [Bacteroidota bacterium]